MHTDVIKILFKAKIFAGILDKVDFVKTGFFANYEYYVLIRDGLIVKASSYIIRTYMNAWIWLNICISRISQENISHELTLK